MPGVPYSGKKKKQQLKERRERKQAQKTRECDKSQSVVSGEVSSSATKDVKKREEISVEELRQQFLQSSGRRFNPDRYRLMFFRDSNEEIERRKELSRVPYTQVIEESLETCTEDMYKPGSCLDIPRRPEWRYSDSKAATEAREEHYFREYLLAIFREYSPSQLSYFELNLETWRQLWRVLEMSDILLIITDIRHPALHFPPALYSHITHDLHKKVILILNKVDLAPPSLVVAWQHYFQVTYPDLQIVCFSSYPKHQDENETEDFEQVYHKRRRRRRQRVVPLGPRELLESCLTIAPDRDLSSWRDKVCADWSGESRDPDDPVEVGYRDDSVQNETESTAYITIGCLGYPNVGKSSVLNALMGKKVVSVSRQPGHTKHFQTIFLTPDVRVCDCPGLVFPSLVSKSLQILAGIYPISQVREPYSPISYLAQRIPLPTMLALPQSTGTQWSAFSICDAWAEKRGFTTARTARNDVYRAANNLLRVAVEGRLRLCFYPPSFTQKKDFWETHADTVSLRDLLHRNAVVIATEGEGGDDSGDSGSPDDAAGGGGEERSDGEDEESEDDIRSDNPFSLLGDE